MNTPRIHGAIQRVLRRFGYSVVRTRPTNQLPHDMDLEFTSIYRSTINFTMTPMVRMYAFYQAVRYVEKHGIAGDIVECGVWKGGSSMVAALSLLSSESISRRLWLYDTFSGITEPNERDARAIDGIDPHARWRESQRGEINEWMYSPLEEVKANLNSTGYPDNQLVFVQGRVEDTIPGSVPNSIAILRLDTDWYGSTYHQLIHLFPLLSPGGVLIIDDYGWWKGCRDATDRYFEENPTPVLLHRIDESARIGKKQNLIDPLHLD